MNLAPIVLFVYNRPEHTRKTLLSLSKNFIANQCNLFIYSDGPKKPEDIPKIKEVREIIHKISGFKSLTINQKEKNEGLATSVIRGVTDILKNEEKVIVMEDDMISSPNFLTFMNETLDIYESQSNIYAISGYTFPIEIPPDYKNDLFLARRVSSWGWATWRNRWQNVDWTVTDFPEFRKDRQKQRSFNEGGEDLSRMLKKQMIGKIDSWAVRWNYHVYKNNGYCLYPVVSKIVNIGNDNSGTHSTKSSKYTPVLDNKNQEINYMIPLFPDLRLNENMKKMFQKSIYKRIIYNLYERFL